MRVYTLWMCYGHLLGKHYARASKDHQGVDLVKVEPES